MGTKVFIGGTQMMISQDDYRNSEEFKEKSDDAILGFLEKCKEIQKQNPSIDLSTTPKVRNSKKKKKKKKLCNYFQFIHQIIVFPETIGTWLVTLNAPSFIFDRVKSMVVAIVLVMFCHFFSFIWELFEEIVFRSELKRFSFLGVLKRALWRARASIIFKTYYQTYSELALQSGCYIVAGSVFLPHLKFEKQNHKVHLSHSGLYNVSIMFDPLGRPIHVTHKTNLVPEEAEFLDSGKIEEAASVTETAFGKVATLICADSWHQDLYDFLKPQKPDLVVVPSMIMPAETWQSNWGGYVTGKEGAAPFSCGVDERDIGNAKESEMWTKYSLEGRIKTSGAKIGVLSVAHGSLWDVSLGGTSVIIGDKQTQRGTRWHDWPENLAQLVTLN